MTTSTYLPVNVGLQPNDGVGDNIRDAFIKVNNSFAEIMNTLGLPQGEGVRLRFIDLADTPKGYLLGHGSTDNVTGSPVIVGINGEANLVTNHAFINTTSDITITFDDQHIYVQNTYLPSITATSFTTVLRDSTGGIFATNVTDSSLTIGRVTFAGTSGKLIDNSNFTYTGGNLNVGSGNITASGTVQGSNVIDTGLTINRVVVVGSGGQLIDSSHLTFSSNQLTVDGDAQVNGNLYFKSASDNTDTMYITKSDISSDVSDLVLYTGDNGGATISLPTDGVDDFVTIRSAVGLHHAFGSDGGYTAAGNITTNGELTITNANGHGGSGYAGIITMTNTGSGTPNKYIRLNNAGNFQIVNSAYSNTIFDFTDAGDLTITGSFRASGNVTAYYSSDAKFKENVSEIQGALDSVGVIGGKTYDWTDEYIASHGGEDDYFVSKNDFGVIAQDVLKVFPRAVKTRTDGSLAVDYQKLVALAFAAINELKSELDEVKKSLPGNTGHGAN